jgi:hypothetical protein
MTSEHSSVIPEPSLYSVGGSSAATVSTINTAIVPANI